MAIPITATMIRLMNQACLSNRPAVVEGLLQGVQNKVRMGGAGGPPSDNPSGEGVDHESHIDEARPCGDIGIRAGTARDRRTRRLPLRRS